MLEFRRRRGVARKLDIIFGMQAAEQKPPEPPVKRNAASVALAWGSLALAVAESICVAMVGLSGVRVLLGLGSLLAAGAGGPAHGFHREALRIPLLAMATVGSLLSLLLLWNEDRLRRNPAAAWRVQPLTQKHRHRRMFNFWAAVVTLLLVAGEVITHTWFHHETLGF